MTGDGTNDAPRCASRRGRGDEHRHAGAKEAGNMVDLDSNPTKLIEIVEIGKQLLMTRGALTTFSHRQRRREVLRHHPGAFATTYPQLESLNVMHLATRRARFCRR
jgi:K+-transporting ATPase ATPase B chain